MQKFLSNRRARSGSLSVNTTSRSAIERLDRRTLLSVTWDGGGDGVNWTDPLNWSGDLVPAITDDVVIGGPGSTVSLSSGAQAIASLTLGRSLTVSSAASLKVNGAVNVDAGMLTFAAGSSAALHTPRFEGLSVAVGAAVDLTDNALVVDYPGFASSYASLLSLTKSGYANGTWTGPGIRSSTAAATPKTAVGIFAPSVSTPFTFAGQLITDEAVLLRYTLSGNTYIYDQAVNFDDVFVLAKFYHSPASAGYWVDTNFDGIVDFADLLSVVQNYGRSLLSNPTQGGSHFDFAGRVMTRAESRKSDSEQSLAYNVLG